MKTKTIINICLVLLLFAINLNGQESSNDENYPLVNTLANEFLKKTGLPGLSIAVNKKGKLIYSKGFGMADVNDKIPVEVYTQFRAASVSKVITATALGKLVSDGKLDLDAPIQKYISDIDSKYAHLTTRQLASHTSGLKHRSKGKSNSKKQYTTKQTVDLITDPLQFEPGSDYRYSSAGFNLLAAVIEGASGQSFTKYMKENIFKPLNMNDTYPEVKTELTTQAAKLYTLKKGKLKEEKRLSNGTIKLAGAGFRSTPTDLVKMMDAYSNGFIADDVVNEMFERIDLKDGRKIQIGLAWRCSTDAFGNEVIEHAGNWQGARSVVVYYPKEQLSISIMINARCQIFIEEMAHIFAQQFFENRTNETVQHSISQKVKVSIKLSDGTTGKYSGKLELENGNGILKVDREANFINTNPIYYLGFGNYYATISNFGILYLKGKTESEFSGQIYLYGSMNKSNPIDNEPVVTFNTYF